MEATKENEKIATEIISLLAKNNCTIKQSAEILSFVAKEIQNSSTVQCHEVTYFLQ